MSLSNISEIIQKSLKKEEEFKAFFDCEFDVIVEEDNGFIFMISKGSNLSYKFRQVLGDGSVQISYNTYRGGTITIRSDFEFGRWFNKIKENVDFAKDYLGFKFSYQIDDRENEFGYNNGFEISIDNVDENLEKEFSQLLVLLAFILDV